jgi:hypothetical protein
MGFDSPEMAAAVSAQVAMSAAAQVAGVVQPARHMAESLQTACLFGGISAVMLNLWAVCEHSSQCLWAAFWCWPPLPGLCPT